MVRWGGVTQRLGGVFASVTFVFTVSACATGSPSASPSLGASGSQAPTDSAPFASPSLAPTPIPTPFVPTSSSNLFSLLPASQPADYVSHITCTGTIGTSDPVAVVGLLTAVEGEDDLVMRDYADPSNPRTICTFGQFDYIPQLIDARHAVLDFQSHYAVIDLPEVRYHWFQPPEGLLAVGPKLDRVLWLTVDPEVTATDTIHLSTAAGDHVIARLPNNNFGRCGSAEDSKRAAFTASGSHFFVLDQPLPDANSLVIGAGEAAILSVIPPSGGWPDGGHPAMALWSPTMEVLYYRQGGDVWKWTAGGADPELFLKGVNWYYPTISPDGTHLAYSILRADLLHDVYLVDLAQGGTPQKIGGGARKLPVFLNNTQLWFRSEGDDHGCAGSQGEKPLIYNIVDGSEAPSIIDRPMTVWPATSSNF